MNPYICDRIIAIVDTVIYAPRKYKGAIGHTTNGVMNTLPRVLPELRDAYERKRYHDVNAINNRCIQLMAQMHEAGILHVCWVQRPRRSRFISIPLRHSKWYSCDRTTYMAEILALWSAYWKQSLVRTTKYVPSILPQ
jgi:hypothetical protein